MNELLADSLMQKLTKYNISEFVICAGARNAPFVQLLSKYSLKTYFMFDERSAAFFALGRIKAMGRPVIILTTSGTAVAECLPAVIEAHYCCLPLIVVSADRPKRFRKTGAPQSIEQVGIFSHYCSLRYDIDSTREISLDLEVI